MSELNIEYQPNDISDIDQPKFKIPKIIPILLAICVIVCGGLLVYEKIKMEELQDLLLTRTWERHELEDDSIYTLELDFSEGYVKYNFDGYVIPKTTIQEYSYEIVAHDTIIFIPTDYGAEREIKVTFNDSQEMMTFEPSLTDLEDEEDWFVH